MHLPEVILTNCTNGLVTTYNSIRALFVSIRVIIVWNCLTVYSTDFFSLPFFITQLTTLILHRFYRVTINDS